MDFEINGYAALGAALRVFFWASLAVVTIWIGRRLPISWQKILFYKFWDTPLSPWNNEMDRINKLEAQHQHARKDG